ncbi:MAG: hypothetical protein JWR27_2318 [Aeromicrobium sp.]|jgi:hypothetical protein|nr:hypothetical protein [Aeromicrobium sp.]
MSTPDYFTETHAEQQRREIDLRNERHRETLERLAAPAVGQVHSRPRHRPVIVWHRLA